MPRTQITLAKNKSGTVDIFEDGKKVSTASSASAEQLARARGGDFIGFAPRGYTPPNQITPIKKPSQILTSQDHQQRYSDNSNNLDNIINGTVNANNSGALNGGTDSQNTGQNKNNNNKLPNEQIVIDKNGQQAGEKRGTEKTGNVLYDNYSRKIDSLQKSADEFNTKADQSVIDYSGYYKTSLANIDTTVQSTLDNIQATYAQRIREQKRINQIRTDGRKAYGLSSGGRFTPLAFKDAVTLQEEDGNSRIAELENQRNALISQAKVARDLGKSRLLKEKLDLLGRIDQELTKNLFSIQKKSDEQYKLLREQRRQEEDLHQKKLEQMRKSFQNFAYSKYNDYKKMSEEEKSIFIEEQVQQTGLDFAEIYNTMEGASVGMLDFQKKQTAINNQNSLIRNRQASTQKSILDTSIKNKEQQTKQAMKSEIPTDFQDEADFKAKRQAFTKKYGVSGGKYWDTVFDKNKDSLGTNYSYKTKGGIIKKNSNDKDPLGIL